MGVRRWMGALMLVAAALAVPACGGDSGAASFTKAGPPPPPECLERWNGDQTALQAGQHAYSPGHDSRAARVTLQDMPEQTLKDVCLVVFAANENDREYGILGEFSTGQAPANTGLVESAWQSITNLPTDSPQERIELQRSGAERANAGLGEDGRLAPLD